MGKPAMTGLEITDPIHIGEPGLPLEDLIGRFPFHDGIPLPGHAATPFDVNPPNVGCSGCSKPKDSSSTTGISQPSTDGIGNLQPSPCPTIWHCKRPSLKKQGEMVCCLRVERRGRFKCPNSCD